MRRHGRVVALVAAVGIGVGAIAATVVALLLLLGLFVGAAFSNSFEVPERDHLEPIPIDVAACPYVTAMHNAANQFQISYPTLGTAYNANQQPLTWQETQVRLDRASAVLEYSIAASVERFPTQVQRYLMRSRDALTEGRAQLSVASSGSDFATRTSHLLQEGQLAFGYAGDLIGSQCPVPLRADSDTMLYPFLTSTVPANAPTPQ